MCNPCANGTKQIPNTLTSAAVVSCRNNHYESDVIRVPLWQSVFLPGGVGLPDWQSQTRRLANGEKYAADS
ncbi:hypothetical protein LCGC14_1830150 [marine sediment metagenome]|uniref:Uncharacterized protein n=1 Tax=marine sediment metagenome TaxID=412755 RepID=A0A0F9IVX2_9ZZZZ